jgi:uncharacterized membrane protein YphA (DoxX/SURF4 family)
MAIATTARGFLRARMKDDVHQSFVILRSAFTIAPILFGLDKFFNIMVEWPQYLAPWINDLVPGDAQSFMYVVGVIEIIAGVVVAFAPHIGGYVVAAWLSGIVVNLLTGQPPHHYDIALRDVGLALAALSLGRMATGLRARSNNAREATPGALGRHVSY